MKKAASDQAEPKKVKATRASTSKAAVEKLAAKKTAVKAGTAKSTTGKAAAKTAVKSAAGKKSAKTTATKAVTKTTAPKSTAKSHSKAVVKDPAKTKAEPKRTTARKTAKAPEPANLPDIVAAAAAEHKPIDPVLLDVTGLSSVADWFFIATAENARQMSAIADKIVRRAREKGLRALGQEGLTTGHWALVDLGDLIVHIFSPEARELYDLEGLWADAPKKRLGGSSKS